MADICCYLSEILKVSKCNCFCCSQQKICLIALWQSINKFKALKSCAMTCYLLAVMLDNKNIKTTIYNGMIIYKNVKNSHVWMVCDDCPSKQIIEVNQELITDISNIKYINQKEYEVDEELIKAFAQDKNWRNVIKKCITENSDFDIVVIESDKVLN